MIHGGDNSVDSAKYNTKFAEAIYESPLFISGIFGFAIGLLHPNWQVAVEGAQAVAGIVQYPMNNPFGYYELQLWTILHQISALFLICGMSELTLSILLSGIAGAIGFQAFSLIVWSFSKNIWLSIGAPFFILWSGAAEGRITYSVMILGSEHTYGTIGLLFLLLVISLLGAGFYRIGFLFMGISVSVHPSLGFFGNILIIISLLILWRCEEYKNVIKKNYKYLLAGYFISAISLVINRIQASLMQIDANSSEIEAVSLAFLKYWDTHRVAFYFFTSSMMKMLLTTAVSIFGMAKMSRILPSTVRLPLLLFALTGTFGLLLSGIQYIPPNSNLFFLYELMPARLLNLNIIALMPVLLGIAACLLGSIGSMLIKRSLYFVKAVKIIITVLFIFSAIMFTAESISGFRNKLRIFSYYDNTGLFKAAFNGKGLLATAGDLHLIQLRTRRPILIDGGSLDTLPYSKRCGPEMNRILREVYGIDIKNPPKEIFEYRRSAIPTETNKLVWESRRREEWSRIKAEFGITNILCFDDWKIDLPLISKGNGLALYEL